MAVNLGEGLRDFAVCSEGDIEHNYPIGRFEIGPQGESGDTLSFSIIVVGIAEDGKVLVAFPQKAWHRRAQNRLLPPNTITKGLCLEVGACEAEARQDLVLGVACKIWLGWLSSSLLTTVDFESDEAVDYPFVLLDSTSECFPSAAALQAAAIEKFDLEWRGEEVTDVGRLAALEAQIMEMREGLNLLIAGQSKRQVDGGSGFQTAAEDAYPAVATAAPLPPRPPGLARPKAVPVAQAHAKLKNPAFAGLDPGTVAEALKSGIPHQHLEAMSKLMMDRPGKLPDFPGRVQMKEDGRDLLGDDDEDAEDDEGQAMNAALQTGDPVSQALVQLTEIVKNMHKKQTKVSSLEDVLDAASGQALSSVDQPSLTGKKHVKAMEALRKALRHEPHLIYKSIERLMAEDFGLRSATPNAPAPDLTSRGWAEHRSRIMGYPRTVRWVWGVCGILDCLREGRPEEARARCCLMLCQAEQESLDKGSHILSQEMSLEPPPPYAGFNLHTLPDPMEVPFTRIMDPRWIDAMTAKVKEADDYLERRRKLGQKGGTGALRDPAADAPVPKPKPKPKGKGKGDQTETPNA